MAKTRIKQDAVNYRAPQDRDECDGHINRIGILDGEIKSLQAEMNAEIAKVTETFIGKFSPKQDEMKLLQQGVKLFCEANRMDLTQKGRVKTVNFLSGVVQWRQRPPRQPARPDTLCRNRAHMSSRDRPSRTIANLHAPTVILPESCSEE